MEKELFDKGMEFRGWIPQGKIKMDLASSVPSSPNECKKMDDLYHYSHKCGMTISVDDEEINNLKRIDFDSWYESTAKNYFDSLFYAFCRGKRFVTSDGEYITAECTTETFMNMQIDKLTVNDDYILQHRGKHFSLFYFKKIHTATFHKPRPRGFHSDEI